MPRNVKKLRRSFSLKEENRKILSQKDMIIDSLKDEYKLEAKKLHDKLEKIQRF